MYKSVYINSLYRDITAIFGHTVVLHDIFLYGGHLEALCFAVIVLFVSLFFRTGISLPLLASAYVLVLIVYSYDYYKDVKKDMASNPERASFVAGQVTLYPYVLGIYLASFIALSVYLGNLPLTVLSFALMASGMLYSVLFKGFTRRIPGFKNVYTSAIWAAGGTFYVAAYYSTGLSPLFFLVFMFIFLRIIVNTIFYDTKDLDVDRHNGLKTLPAIMGKGATIKLLHIFNVMGCIPILIGVSTGAMQPYALSLASSCISMASYLVSDDKMGYARYTLADAEVLLWPILFLVGQAVFCGLR